MKRTTTTATAPRTVTRYRCLIVEPPATWQPAGELDAPPAFKVLELSADRQRRATAEGIVFGFNAVAMAAGGSKLWMVMVRYETGKLIT